MLLDVPSYDQRKLGYPTGCEIIALSMMLNYKSYVPVSELFFKMPFDQNPNLGFRGNPSTDGGFTVFPDALMALTSEYVLPHNLSGCMLDDITDKLSAGIPVVAWVSGLGFGVHAVCLTGYDERGVFYNDPWTAEKDAFLTFEEFNKIWDKPIRDPESDITYEPRKALSYYNNSERRQA